MKEEEHRRNRFENVLDTKREAAQASTPAPAPAPAPVQAQPVVQPVQQVVVPAPVAAPIVKEEKEEKVDIKAEIRSALEEHTKKKDPASYYISGLVGLGKYPDVINVRGKITTGVALGVVTPERVVVEGTFHYANYELEDVNRSYYYYYPRIVDMRQYNLGAAVKYQLLPGRIRPNIGGAVGYTRRAMSEYGVDFRTSDAFDVGVVTGLDLQLTDVLAIGLDFRYMTNITYSEKSDYPRSFVYSNSSNPVEKLDYYIGTLSGKLTF
jgi:hypothetical protein